jgi:hypothetical protein
MKSLRIGSAARQIAIGNVKPMLTDMQAGNEERVKLYHSQRWLRARRRFLREHPLCRLCEEQGIVREATAVDHRLGHNRRDWLALFWLEERWQLLCLDCHASKSAAELAAWRRSGEGAVAGG